MNRRILNLLLIITSLFGYLEWGGGNRMFLWQIEYDVLTKLLADPASVLHPLVVLPILGQGLLLITLFQRQPNRVLTWVGIGCLGLLLSLLFLIGVMNLEIKILLSTVPFLATATVAVWQFKKQNSSL